MFYNPFQVGPTVIIARYRSRSLAKPKSGDRVYTLSSVLLSDLAVRVKLSVPSVAAANMDD